MWHLKPDWNSWAKAYDKIGRFDADVPVETVILANPDSGHMPEADREKVDEHVVHKLAQTPASHRIPLCDPGPEAAGHQRIRVAAGPASGS